MILPVWADKQLSDDLPVLRAHGEGQNLEYMKEFPQNTRELAKEVAAFATSNNGTILIGVADGGDLIGLQGMEDATKRDSLLRRLEGICNGTVKPSITPLVRFGVDDEKVVLVLVIPKGGQPVYYSGNIPYVRHLTTSRPAEPHEVIELISEQLKLARPETSDNDSQEDREFYSDLARILINILIYSDETASRGINPWLDMWRAEFGNAAAELRELAAQEIAASNEITESLKQLSDSLDEVASFRLHLGCGEELHRLTVKAAKQAEELKAERIDTFPLSDESSNHIRETITVTTRKLQEVASRAANMMNSGRADELQSEASDLGKVILQISHYNIQTIDKQLLQELREIGRDLHLVETMRLYMDGGHSANAVVEKITTCSNRLKSVVQQL